MVYKITVNGCGHTAKHRKWNLPMAMDTQQNNADGIYLWLWVHNKTVADRICLWLWVHCKIMQIN
ncbi:hypothetical protein V6Z11_D10G118100 [Gossypium hirsutum]